MWPARETLCGTFLMPDAALELQAAFNPATPLNCRSENGESRSLALFRRCVDTGRFIIKSI